MATIESRPKIPAGIYNCNHCGDVLSVAINDGDVILDNTQPAQELAIEVENVRGICPIECGLECNIRLLQEFITQHQRRAVNENS